MKHRLFLQHFLSYLAILCIPLLLLGGSSFLLMNNQTDKLLSSALLHRENNNAASVFSLFNEVDSIDYLFNTGNQAFPSLERILNDVPLTWQSSRDARLLFDTLVSRISTRQDIDSIYIRLYGYDKRIFTSEKGIQTISVFSDKSLLELQEQQEESLWYLVRTKNEQLSSQKSVLTVNKELSSKRGCLTVNYNIAYLTSQLDSLCTYEGQAIFLTDNSHNLLVSSSQASDNMMPSASSLSSEHLASQNSNLIFWNTDNIYGMKYISIIPKSSVYGSENYFRTALIFAVSLSVILSVILASVLAQKRLLNQHLEESQRIAAVNEARLMEAFALQSQISPHFLFNTLENINWKAVALTGKPNSVNAMLKELSAILHYSMQFSAKPVPVQDEIENTRHYTEIMSMRYPGRVEVSWECSPDAMHFRLPRMILQPLAENAYSHGLLKKSGTGHLQIRILTHSSALVIIVCDDGIGMLPEELSALSQRLTFAKEHPTEDTVRHIGLPNISRRLFLQFHEHCRFTIESTPGNGTRITLTIDNISLFSSD